MKWPLQNFHLIFFLKPTDAGDCSTVKGCLNMWLEFSCNYMSQQRSIAAFKVVKSAAGARAFTFKSTKKNVWEQQEGLSLYHNKRNKTIRVVIKKLEPKDIGKYKFSFYRSMESSEEQEAREVEVKHGKKCCFFSSSDQFLLFVVGGGTGQPQNNILIFLGLMGIHNKYLDTLKDATVQLSNFQSNPLMHTIKPVQQFELRPATEVCFH